MTGQKHRLSHKQEIGWILYIVFALGVFLFSLFGPQSYRELMTARNELQARQARVEQLEHDNDQRREKIGKFETRQGAALEEYLRENGYGNPDDIIQIMPQQ